MKESGFYEKTKDQILMRKSRGLNWESTYKINRPIYLQGSRYRLFIELWFGRLFVSFPSVFFGEFIFIDKIDTMNLVDPADRSLVPT